MDENMQVVNEQENQQGLSEILQIRRDRLEALKSEGKNPFEITTYTRTSSAKDVVEKFEELDGKEVSLAGRIMSWRDMGRQPLWI